VRIRLLRRSAALLFSLTLSTGTAWAQPGGSGARVIGTTALAGLPPGPLYWHLDAYPTRAAAAAARDARGTVAQSFGRVWLFTIAEAGWRPAGGERVATIGPLPLSSRGPATASYLDAATAPGFQTDVHQHAGPEAIYTLSGGVCLETPRGRLVGRAGGEPLLVGGGQPMQLTSIGTEVRRSIVLVLHDSSQPWKVPADGWSPPGRCAG
jgi:hypothetical protein